MSPSRMNEHQAELIDGLMEENERLHQQIDEMDYRHKLTTVSYLKSHGILVEIGGRNFRISMVLSILLVIETIYIIWRM